MTDKQPVVSRKFLISICGILVPMLLIVAPTWLQVTGVVQTMAWHKQNRSQLQYERWNLELPRWWLPQNQQGLVIVRRISLFHHNSGLLAVSSLPPDSWAMQNRNEWEQYFEKSSGGAWVKSPVLQLEGKPGTCLVHDQGGSVSGECLSSEDGLYMHFTNAPMKEVASILSSAHRLPSKARR